MKLEIIIQADFDELKNEDDRIAAIIPQVETVIKSLCGDLEDGPGSLNYFDKGMRIVNRDGDPVGNIIVDEIETHLPIVHKK